MTKRFKASQADQTQIYKESAFHQSGPGNLLNECPPRSLVLNSVSSEGKLSQIPQDHQEARRGEKGCKCSHITGAFGKEIREKFLIPLIWWQEWKNLQGWNHWVQASSLRLTPPYFMAYRMPGLLKKRTHKRAVCSEPLYLWMLLPTRNPSSETLRWVAMETKGYLFCLFAWDNCMGHFPD